MTGHRNTQKMANSWHILGAGAIGSLWALRLQNKGYDVRLLLSPRRLAQPQLADSLSLNFAAHADATPVTSELGIAQADDSLRRVVLATKANDAVLAIRRVKSRLLPGAEIITLCNGMGYHQAIAEECPDCAVYAMTTTDGAYFRDNSGDESPTLVLAGKGQSKIAGIGSPSDRKDQFSNSKVLAGLLSTRGHQVRPRHGAQRMLLDKLLINACINGLTAIHDCNNGSLLRIPAATDQLRLLIAECGDIALAAGQKTLALGLSARVERVVQATAKNYSSTCTDIRNGRTSEIEYINTYLVNLAASLNRHAPHNSQIVEQINRLQTSQAS